MHRHSLVEACEFCSVVAITCSAQLSGYVYRKRDDCKNLETSYTKVQNTSVQSVMITLME